MNRHMALGLIALAPLVALDVNAATVDITGTTVVFKGITDAIDSDPTSDADTVGFNAMRSVGTGDSLELGKVLNGFKSAGQPVSDVMTFTIEAKPNHFITSVKYRESGGYEWDIGVGGVAFIQYGANWTVGSVYQDLAGAFSVGTTSGKTTGSWAIPGSGFTTLSFAPGLTSIDVSISNSLASAAVNGTAEIWKEFATVEVGTAFIPLPPSVWLLGSALFGVGVLGRRIRGLKAA